MTKLVRLLDMLRRRGAALPNPPDADALAAFERCERCLHKGLCDELLASPGTAGNRSFCPNAQYVECLREARLKF